MDVTTLSIPFRILARRCKLQGPIVFCFLFVFDSEAKPLTQTPIRSSKTLPPPFTF